jgi:hypothetical protein
LSTEVEVDPELILLQRRKLALAKRQLELVKKFGLAFYKPFEKQAAFHAAGNYRLRMMRSGNRFGKSTMGCAEDCAWMLGERAWFPKDDPRRYIGIPQRPVKGLVITTDWDKVKEIWTGDDGKIFKMLPEGSVEKTNRNHSGAIDYILLKNGSTLRFDTVESFKKNPQGSESSDWDFIHVDEPCPEKMFKASARGLMDRNGKAWFTLTPLTEFWINDLFFPQDGTKRDSIWAEVGNTHDNPYLSAEAIAEYESSLNEDERECRIRGIPLELSGLVYKEFTQRHILEKLPSGWLSWDNPPADHVIYAAIDPHPQTPHAVLFVAVGPFGLPIAYDEIFMHMPADDLADAVIAKLRGREHLITKCDPIAWIEDPISFSCMANHFIARGLMVEKASKAKEFGILNMKSVLKAPYGVAFARCGRFAVTATTKKTNQSTKTIT